MASYSWKIKERKKKKKKKIPPTNWFTGGEEVAPTFLLGEKINLVMAQQNKKSLKPPIEKVKNYEHFFTLLIKISVQIQVKYSDFKLMES